MKVQKTTVTGIGSLLVAIGLIAQDYNNIFKPEVITSIITGIGLICAADNKK